MEKERFVRERIDKLIQFWTGWALFFGALYFILLSILDYVATPENFSQFIKFRFLGAFIFTLLLILNRKRPSRRHQIVLIYLGVTVSSIIIEYMILHFGGHSSTYYAGLFILVMVVVGFIPLDLKDSLYITLIALSIYVIPIIFFDSTLKYNYFSMPLAFLISTFTIANVWRYLSQKSLVNELSLQYDLEQQKGQLEKYSTQLELLVQERTQELNKSEQWHRSLYENATEGIIVLDRNGIIVNANDKVCEMHGFSRDALIGAHIKHLETETNKEKVA